jgi:hypothetical protein
MEWSLQSLGMEIPVISTNEFRPDYDGENWMDWRDKIRPSNLGDLPAVKYRQVFEDRLGFLPNLSVLDLLFCEGKQARRLLSGGPV